jgi:aryl-alcohol dehydrogenase-like predicted oxidoreductase
MLERLENFAEEQGHPMVELAIAWLLSNSSVSSVIAGATKTDQVIANAKAAGWQLTESDMEEVANILKGN